MVTAGATPARGPGESPDTASAKPTKPTPQRASADTSPSPLTAKHGRFRRPASRAVTPPPPDPASTRRRRRVALVSVIVVLAAVLIGGPGFGVYYFGARAKPGVTVLGRGVAGQTQDQLTATLTALGQDLIWPLTDGQTTVQATGNELGVSLDVAGSVASALAESGPNPWTTYAPWQKKPAPVVLTIDQPALQTALDRLFVPPAETAVDATVTFDEAQGRFVTHPSRTGIHSRLDPVIAQLLAQAADGGLGPINVTTETSAPLFTDQAAQLAADQANARLGLAITLTNGQSGWAERTYQVPVTSLAAWTVITPNPATGQFDVTLNDTALTADVTTALTEQVATPMKPTIEVMDPRSPDDTLGYEWGQDGTKVADLGGTIAQVRQALLGGQNLTDKVTLVDDPATELKQLPPTNFDEPHGAKWIDVNKTTFLATAYEGTTQVNQFIISIGRGGAYETADGTHYIYLKYDYQIMRGGTGTVEGRYEYATPVTWVSYFNADQAFHQADWNTWQGTWQQRVSHGCVNMRGEDAQWIFNWAPIGTKVVVHY